MSFLGAGTNPAWGRDAAPPPPNNRVQGALSPYPFGYPHLHHGGMLPAFNAANFYAQQHQPYHPGLPAPAPQVAFANIAGHHAPGQGQGQGQGQSQPPAVDTALPAANMTNSTGGVGCEPGYNYFFPSEHTKIHVFKTGDTPPWNLPPGYAAPFHAVHVPVGTTLGDLLKGFGATNPVPDRNRVFEVHQGGSGRWYKGLSYKGDDVGDMGTAIKDVGWDQSRNGLPGGKPVVYLYVTNG